MDLTPQQVARAAELLHEARTTGVALDGLGELAPPDEVSAEAISDQAAALTSLDVAGWKVGCTSKLAMEILGAPGPFAGRVFSDVVYDGNVPTTCANPALECEFGFWLGHDLPGRQEPYADVSEVRAATEAVSPAIEIVAPRFGALVGPDYKSLIADHGANAGVQLGEPVAVDELPLLAEVEVVCRIDGEVVSRGTGAAVLEDPWTALLWLAEHLRGRGIGLWAGQFVMSGTCTGIDPLPPGSTAVVTHEGLGEVSLRRP